MVKYSFCITCYNSKDIVDDFIEPLLNLKDDYEIIIVDGGSKDGTYEKLKKYEKDNIKILRENCSIGKGRDIALKASQGEIIITLDFDVRIEKPLMIVENFNKLKIKPTGLEVSKGDAPPNKLCIVLVPFVAVP